MVAGVEKCIYVACCEHEQCFNLICDTLSCFGACLMPVGDLFSPVNQ